MTANEKTSKLPVLWRMLRWVLLSVIVYAFIGFLLVPQVAKYFLTKNLSSALHREVLIDRIRFNPFALSARLSGVLINNQDGEEPLFSLEEFYTNLQASSLFRKGLILREVRIQKPRISLIRKKDNSYNISDLLTEKQEQEKQEPAQPFRFSLHNIQLLDGSIDFRDEPRDSRHEARDITLKIPMISNFPYFVETFVQPLFQATINETPVSLEGRTKPFHDSLETLVDLDIKKIDIPRYLAYVPLKLNFSLLSGALEGKSRITFTQYRDSPSTLTFAGDLSLTNLRAEHKDNSPLINLPSVDLSLAPSDLIAGRIHLTRLMVLSPEVHVKRDSTGALNLLSLIGGQGSGAAEKGREGGSSGLLIEADTAGIRDGTLVFFDQFVDKAFETRIGSMDVQIDHFSTDKDRKSALTLTFETESAESLKLSSDISLSPLAAEGTLALKQVVPKKYSSYYRDALPFVLEDAALDLQMNYRLVRRDDSQESLITNLEAVIRNLRLKNIDEKEDFLKIPAIAVNDGMIDIEAKEVRIGKLSTEKGSVSVVHRRDGTFNVYRPLPALARKLEESVEKKEEAPWTVSLGEIVLDGYTVKAEDQMPPEPVRMIADQIRITSSDISTKKNSRGTISYFFRLNKEGTLSVKGSLGINPLSAEVQLDLKDLDIMPLQPYVRDRINIMITDGRVSAEGSLSYVTSADKGFTGNYNGTVSLSRFASVDAVNTEDFLTWDSFYLNGLDVGLNPFYLNINEVALTDFYSRLIVNPDGSLNVQDVIKSAEAGEPAPEKSPSAEPPAEEKKPEGSIKIDAVTLQAGTVSFSDRHIKPNYSATFLELGGRISGLSSVEESSADVNLKGTLENHAPLEITGKINPLAEDLFVDLAIDFKDMDLSPVTPYSNKYAGYTIQKGKLSLEMKYLIRDKKLDSENRVFLDQFTFGEKVDSPDATTLPVRLAVALLKNRKGEIHLDLPVSGKLDDPEFRIGGIILKMIVNILVKAATSPFALLGAIVGGGEELNYVEFDAGSFALNEQALAKLGSLEKALSDRPFLSLEISGYVDREKDSEGLTEMRFQHKLKSRKLKEMVKSGQAGIPLDDIIIEPGEYETYLREAYRAETFPKPRNALGFTKKLPVPEMEKLMFSHIVITDDNLRTLASQRALKVKDFLLESGQIEGKRIFLTEPDSLEPEKKETLKNSRVEFALK